MDQASDTHGHVERTMQTEMFDQLGRHAIRVAIQDQDGTTGTMILSVG